MQTFCKTDAAEQDNTEAHRADEIQRQAAEKPDGTASDNTWHYWEVRFALRSAALFDTRRSDSRPLELSPQGVTKSDPPFKIRA